MLNSHCKDYDWVGNLGCKKCALGWNLKKNKTTGHCSMSWWLWLIIIVCSLIGILLLAFIVYMAIKMFCGIFCFECFAKFEYSLEKCLCCCCRKKSDRSY